MKGENIYCYLLPLAIGGLFFTKATAFIVTVFIACGAKT
jgi:hypothetical protein